MVHSTPGHRQGTWSDRNRLVRPRMLIGPLHFSFSAEHKLLKDLKENPAEMNASHGATSNAEAASPNETEGCRARSEPEAALGADINRASSAGQSSQLTTENSTSQSTSENTNVAGHAVAQNGQRLA